MRAVVFDDQLRLVPNYPMPEVLPGWALVRVLKAGICRTDIEITKGYMGYSGILGHEFVGIVQRCDDPTWIGKRVVGEINAACGKCDLCDVGLGRHCPNRATLGISGLNGCMADFCTLPITNLREVPSSMPDDRAVFTEPLSAACEIIEQLKPERWQRAVVLGDGKLGILCAWVLATALDDVTLIGHHAEKLELAEWRGLKTALGISEIEAGADIVVEATGSAGGMSQAMTLCAPRGTIVLKSTLADYGNFDAVGIVINELTLVGSRCGQFKDGLRMLETYPDMPIERLITARYPIEQAIAAFEQAMEPKTLKILVEM